MRKIILMITAIFACVGARAKSIVFSKDIMKQCFSQSGLKSDLMECCLNGLSKSSVKCAPGQYLPANAKKCSACKDRYYVCAGGFFIPSSINQGIKKLSYETINEIQESALQQFKEQDCEPGKYLITLAKYKICIECPDGYVCPGKTTDKIKCKDDEIVNADKTKCLGLSDMSEKEACEYWSNNGGGYWNKDNDRCIPPSGSLWEAKWNSKSKTFECLNMFDAAQQWHDAEWRETQKSWFDNYRQHVYDNNGNLKPAVVGLQWDRGLGKCTSKIERQCLANGDTYDWLGICYKHENDEKTCKNVIGGQWKNVNGKKSCECNIGQFDMLSWNPDKCQYKILLNTEKSKTNYINQQNTGAHKYSETIPLEYCFEQYKNGFIYNKKSEPKSKLNCK